MLQSIYFLTTYLLFLMSKIYKVFAHTKKTCVKQQFINQQLFHIHIVEPLINPTNKKNHSYYQINTILKIKNFSIPNNLG